MGQHQDTCTALGICVVANTPVLLWGNPGQGKSSVVEQLASDYQMHLETIIVSICEPSDFGGFPMPNPADREVAFLAMPWARRLAEKGNGIAFYDEISCAPPANQAACLRPVLTSWVGELQLPSGVRTIAAANPADIAAGGWDIAPPLANRFVHLQWNLPADFVRDGFALGWPRIELPQPDKDLVTGLFKEAKLHVASFLAARGELVTQVPASLDSANMGFPTPRSWETVAKLLSFAKAARVNDNVLALLIGGTVGDAAATEFITFVKNLDLPDPEQLLADPNSYQMPRDRGDKAYAIASSVWSAYLTNPTSQRWINVGEVLAALAEVSHADMAYTFAKRWVEDRPAEGPMPSDRAVKALQPILTELGRFLART